MTTYTSHWIHTAPAGKKAPQLIQLTMRPHGYDGHAYWLRQEARTSDRTFKMVEDLRLDPAGGPQAVLQRLVELRHALVRTGFEEIVFDSTVYMPNDLPGHRPKTDDERLMDLAALHTECSDYANALAALHGCSPGAQQAWYWHTAARRIHANRARANPGPDAEPDWAAAVEHATFIIASAADQDTSHPGPAYHFGDSYGNGAQQLAAAAQTLAEFLLCIAQQPAQALQAIQIADATNHGTRDLQQFKVTALLQLHRTAEAYETHRRWSLQMPEVLQSPGYLAFIDHQQTQARDAESQRISQLQFTYATGTPASDSDIAALRQHFAQPSAAYLQWITQPERHQLTVTDGEYSETYELFSIAAALEKHGELMDWLALHDDSSPELAQEIHAAIADSGIDPRHMLPIVGDENTSDCFLLRTDGPDAGAVYFWAHDECTVFSPIVASADQLFPWLQARAQAGDTFVL